VKFEVYPDKADEWRWRLKADNGEIVAVGEGYTREADAERGITDMLAGLSALLSGEGIDIETVEA
jgi:uncharacterized protein YegP (UPF0339 family)